MTNKLVHIIVSSSSWSQAEIKYRRHRLAEYLEQQEDTEDILWVYPVSATPRKLKSYIKAEKIMQKNPCTRHGIKEWALPDYFPGRYMLFKSSFGYLHFTKLKKFVSEYKGKKVLWFTYPCYPYIVHMLNWDVILYDCSDLWTEPSGGSRSITFSAKTAKGLIKSAETRIIKNSNVVFASSDYLAERIEKLSRRQVHTIENGVDMFYFRDNNQDEYSILNNIPRPRLGYVGALRSKIDFTLLDELADQNPGWSIVLIGPDCLNDKVYFHRILQRNNVFWTGEVQPQVVPDYIKKLDIGLLPYREIDYNKAVFPIKFYEYLSQGIPIVGCGIPSTKKYAAKGIYLHVKREDYMEACRKALSWLDSENKLYAGRRIKLAQEASWDKKLSLMLNHVRNQL